MGEMIAFYHNIIKHKKSVEGFVSLGGEEQRCGEYSMAFAKSV
jgi:hypothetical protein